MACLPSPPLSVPLLDLVRHGNAPQPRSLCFEVLLDALEATDTLQKHHHIPAWDKTMMDVEAHADMSAMTHAFLSLFFLTEANAFQ